MDDPTKTRGLLADLGHTDACVHPDQHAAVIREWEDAKAKLDAKLKRKAIGRAYVELRGFAERETARADAAEADVGMWTNFCRDQRQRADRAEAERDALKAARCPSCDHLTTGHQEDGCWYTVTTGTPGRDLVCPCTVPLAALDHPTDGELPGMWEVADLIGGATDAEEAAALDDPPDTTGESDDHV